MYTPMIPLFAALTFGFYYEWPRGTLEMEFYEKLNFTRKVLELVERAEIYLGTPITVAFVAPLPFEPPFIENDKVLGKYAPLTNVIDRSKVLVQFEERVCLEGVDVSFIITPYLIGTYESTEKMTTSVAYTGFASGIGTGRSAIVRFERYTRNFNDAFLRTVLHELGHLIGLKHVEVELGEGMCEKYLELTGKWYIMCSTSSSNIFINRNYYDALEKWQDELENRTAECSK